MKAKKKTKLSHGVGRNDAAYPISIYGVINGRRQQLWICPFYRTWMNMLARCYGVKEHERNPTYIGCSADPAWHSFSEFRAWMFRQQWEGKQLDKDILCPGNKVYSPELCVFVSSQLNSFMTDHGAERGAWPIGVHWYKPGGKFMARCANPFTGSRDFLGYFTCPDAASKAWRQRKHELACAYADQQDDLRIAAALRSRYASKGEL